MGRFTFVEQRDRECEVLQSLQQHDGLRYQF
jgi:hypothetical protein